MSSVSKATVIVAFYQLLHRFRCKLLFSGTIVSMENRRLAALLNHSFRTVARSCSVKKVFLNILQNSQETHKRLRCFSMNFAKFLRTTFFIEHLRWLLLKVYIMNVFPRSFQKTEQFFYRKAVGDFSESRGEELGNSTRQHIFWIFVGTYIKFHKLF